MWIRIVDSRSSMFVCASSCGAILRPAKVPPSGEQHKRFEGRKEQSTALDFTTFAYACSRRDVWRVENIAPVSSLHSNSSEDEHSCHSSVQPFVSSHGQFHVITDIFLSQSPTYVSTTHLPDVQNFQSHLTLLVQGKQITSRSALK